MKIRTIVIFLCFYIFLKHTTIVFATEKNYWPQQLGNYWVYEVTQFNANEFSLWEQNFSGNSTGVGKRDCSGAFGDYKNTTLGSKVAMVLYPSMGYDRFFTSRYLQFYKESAAAYHGPQYCNLGAGTAESTGWNLQWFSHNPFFFNGQYWFGSEGGVRFYRAAPDGRTASPSLLESKSEISGFGKFPKSSGLHGGGGRTPVTNSPWQGVPGYTYIPLNNPPNSPNSSTAVNPDVHFEFGMGFIPPKDNFPISISSFLNDWLRDPLIWDLEYIPLKAANVLTKNQLPADTDILSIVFFEPQQEKAAGTEYACENYYFAANIGLVKLSHSIVTVLPDDASLDKTRQLCFYLYRSDFTNSIDPAKRNTNFQVLTPYLTDINKFKYSYPLNSIELINSKIYNNPAADVFGFHSPAASSTSVPEANSIEFFSNGRYWLFKPNGELYTEGNVHDTWANSNVTPQTVSGKTVYPWTDNGPDEIESGADVQFLLGASEIMVNGGAYWLRNPGTQNPFNNPNGLFADLFPAYGEKFGNDTKNLAIAGTGSNNLFLTKNGYYFLYGKNNESQLSVISEGLLKYFTNWQEAPYVSGKKPNAPDSMMFGKFLDENNNQSPTKQNNPIKSDKQLIVYQQGLVWVKYGLNGDWEKWSNQSLSSQKCLPLGNVNCTSGVDSNSLRALISSFGEGLENQDLNSSGEVNILDIATLLANFGKMITPTQTPSLSPSPSSTLAPPPPTNTPLPTSSPAPTQTPTITPTLAPFVQSFDQNKGDATDARPKQTMVSIDGKTLLSKYYNPSGWEATWTQVNVQTAFSGIPGSPSEIRSFDQSLALANEARQSVILPDGKMYSRTFLTSPSPGWGGWTLVFAPGGTNLLTLPASVTSISCFDQHNNAAGAPTQTVLSGDGTNLYSRVWNGTSWEAWSAPIPISSLNITNGATPAVTAIKSFNQTLAPDGKTKQDVLLQDGVSAVTRKFDGSWQNWNWPGIKLGL